jgi:hypothetical protein
METESSLKLHTGPSFYYFLRWRKILFPTLTLTKFTAFVTALFSNLTEALKEKTPSCTLNLMDTSSQRGT